MSLRHTFEWDGPSADPNDEQFGDVVERTSLENAGAYDAVIVGEPYDGAVIGRRGAREGPEAIRAALAGVKTHHFDAGPVGRVADAGDVTAPFTDVAAVQDEIAETVAPLHEASALPVFVGGDNSVTVGNVTPLLTGGWDAVGTLNFDAHLDCREPVDGPTSGTPYRQLFDAGLNAYACVGARHFETSTAYADYLRARDGTVVTPEEVADDPVGAVDVALDALAVETVHVSLDLDVVDTSEAPGVSAPTPGGVTARELFRMLRLVAAADRVASVEVVECAPPLDEDDRTARVGARAIAHFLAGYGAGRPADEGVAP